LSGARQPIQLPHSNKSEDFCDPLRCRTTHHYSRAARAHTINSHIPRLASSTPVTHPERPAGQDVHPQPLQQLSHQTLAGSAVDTAHRGQQPKVGLHDGAPAACTWTVVQQCGMWRGSSMCLV
jgi:hypothetical protein